MPRHRISDFGVQIGHLPRGPHNAITDVPGVTVGQVEVVQDHPHTVRTGLTIIAPSPDILSRDVFAGVHTHNGSGELAGAIWIEESGLLSSPVAITATHSLGAVRDGFLRLAAELGRDDRWWLPAVGETYDGWLSDGPHSPIGLEHVRQAMAGLSPGPVREGNVGGGVGMICHGFKGGIGTSSRIVRTADHDYVVGTLVQANYGARRQFTVAGVRVGELITPDVVPMPERTDMVGGSSIIVVTATNAPLVGTQCKRLARRATMGLARVGGIGNDGSGDIFLAFSTASQIDPAARSPSQIEMLGNAEINPLFAAVADTTEEAILNALCAADDMTGLHGRRVHGLPHDLLRKALTAAK